MLAEKKKPVLFVERTKLLTTHSVVAEKKAHVIPMPAPAPRRNIEKITSKGYIAAPKHDFL